MSFCRRVWENHSLTIVLTIIGSSLTAGAWLLPEGKAFDTCLGLGQGVLTGGLVFLLSGPLRERNKPEE